MDKIEWEKHWVCFDLKEFVEKMCANTVTLWWESKEQHTTQGEHKNYKDCKKKKTKVKKIH